MPIDPTKLANLLAEDVAGGAIPCAEYLKVTWDTGVINYYGSAAWHEMPPFTGIGQVIEPRLMPQNKKDPFHNLELNPDLRTENIPVLFDDIDGTIRGLFQQYSSGVAAEFFLYYPSQDLTVSIWFGQLQAPDVYGHKTTKAVATNGFRSRELTIPSRRFPRECTASVFAGQLPDTDSVRSSLCPYDRHVGGSVGNYITGTTPYASCPKLSITNCIARLSNNGLYYGGFNTDASAVVTDSRTGYLAVSRSNASNLKEALPVVFGSKWVRKSLLLQWRREDNESNHSQGYAAGVWAICEGPVQAMYNFYVGEQLIGQIHQSPRLGTRGQPRSSYAPDVSNYSSTAHVMLRAGPLDARYVVASDMVATCVVNGFSEVSVYTDDSPVTKTLTYSVNRVWCLLELYKNQKFGFGYAESRFTLADWITTAAWSNAYVSHTATFPDGETVIYMGRRSTFNVIMEGRPAAEQIEDICRAGGLTVPFQHDGAFTIASFRVATTDELNNARVFTDTGQNVNIIWDGGQPMIELSQTPDNKVVNEVEVRFEEAANYDTERPITVDDPNWKLKAGRQLGPDYLLSVPKRYSAYGIASYAEAIRFAYRMLKFGEHDTGGTDNNLKLKITVPFEQALGIRRYDIIKILTSLVDGFKIGLGATLETLDGATAAPFRVLSMRKISGGRCEITAQAYNHTAYSTFETTSSDDIPYLMFITRAGTVAVRGLYSYIGQVDGKPGYDLNGFIFMRWVTADTQWQIIGADNTIYYYSNDNVALPSDVTTWVADEGSLPLPFVVAINPGFGPPPTDPPAVVTIQPPTYDAANQILSIDID